jgi:hypothetical protein
MPALFARPGMSAISMLFFPSRRNATAAAEVHRT